MEFNLAWQANLLSECNVCTIIKEGREKTFSEEIRKWALTGWKHISLELKFMADPIHYDVHRQWTI